MSSLATTTRRSTSGADPTWATSSPSPTATTTSRSFSLLVNRRSRPDDRRAGQRLRADHPRAARQGDGRHPRPVAGPRLDRDRPRGRADRGRRDRRSTSSSSTAPGRPVPRHRDPRARHGPPTPGSSTRSRPTGIPVQPGGRTGLFEQPEAAVFGATFAWLADIDWAPGRFIKREKIELLDAARRLSGGVRARRNDDVQPSSVTSRVAAQDARDGLRRQPGRRVLRARSSCSTSRPGTLTDAHVATGSARSPASRPCSPTTRPSRAARDATPRTPASRSAARPGTSGSTGTSRCCSSTTPTAATTTSTARRTSLADGVALGTIHGAKGLEWPVVFLPSLTDGRFPSSRTGERTGLAAAARRVRRRPLRRLRRRRAPAVLRRAHPCARLGVALVPRSASTKQTRQAVAVPPRGRADRRRAAACPPSAEPQGSRRPTSP